MEQLGGDQHRFYPDIVLKSQPSIHQFSHGSSSGGADGSGGSHKRWSGKKNIKKTKRKENTTQYNPKKELSSE